MFTLIPVSDFVMRCITNFVKRIFYYYENVIFSDLIMAKTSTKLMLLIIFLALVSSGCSIKGMAVNSLANAMSASGTAFAADDDPELIREAVPFSLKTVEILLEEKPNHVGLLLTAAKGFTQYGYGFIEQDADFIEEEDFDEALRIRKRARKLYGRAVKYARRGLEVNHNGFLEAFDSNPDSAAVLLKKKDIPLMYWYAAALGLKISLSKDDPMEIAKLPQVGSLINRAIELDASWDRGALYEFMVSYEGGLSETMGGSPEKAKEHLDNAVRLSNGERAGPYVAYAETVCVLQQNRELFIEMLNKALAVNIDNPSEDRLANIIAQNRARWLLETIDDLFF